MCFLGLFLSRCEPSDYTPERLHRCDLLMSISSSLPQECLYPFPCRRARACLRSIARMIAAMRKQKTIVETTINH
jgi:hypothetical protein